MVGGLERSWGQNLEPIGPDKRLDLMRVQGRIGQKRKEVNSKHQPALPTRFSAEPLMGMNGIKLAKSLAG